MRTTNPSPGKFEGNPSQLLAAAAYEVSMDGSDIMYGDVSERGMAYSIVDGRRWTFIVCEDNQGFVDVVLFDRKTEAQMLQNTIMKIESWDAE